MEIVNGKKRYDYDKCSCGAIKAKVSKGCQKCINRITNRVRFDKELNTNICLCGCKKAYTSTMCSKCKNNELWEKRANRTIGDAKMDKTASRCTYAQIRKHARDTLKKLDVEKKCKICGYNKFVDVAHIVPIKDFSDNTLLMEVNHKDNLLYLCPNHHKEFDNGLLNL
jgi:hypothetical protein